MPDQIRDSRNVEGAEIAFVRSGGSAREPVIFLHCGGGHSGWWSEILPTLTTDMAVVTIDLSGHGESGRRDAYTPQLWADEVGAIIAGIGVGRQGVSVVGHSLGGLVGIYAAARHPERIRQLILIDPPVQHVQARDVPVRSRTYADPEEALQRFVLRPPETLASPDRLRELGLQGLRQTGEGWAWKYDPKASQRFTVEGVAEALAKVRCPISLIYGARSPYADAGTADYIGRIVDRSVSSVEIADAYHHVPLDAPAAVAAAIRDALAAPAVRAVEAGLS